MRSSRVGTPLRKDDLLKEKVIYIYTNIILYMLK